MGSSKNSGILTLKKSELTNGPGNILTGGDVANFDGVYGEYKAYDTDFTLNNSFINIKNFDQKDFTGEIIYDKIRFNNSNGETLYYLTTEDHGKDNSYLFLMRDGIITCAAKLEDVKLKPEWFSFNSDNSGNHPIEDKLQSVPTRYKDKDIDGVLGIIEQRIKNGGNIDLSFPKPLEASGRRRDLNENAKHLAAMFEAFVGEGFTDDERKALEKIKGYYKDATLQLTNDGGALVIDDKGHTFRMDSKGRGPE